MANLAPRCPEARLWSVIRSCVQYVLPRMNIRTARAAKAEYKTQRIAGVQHDVMCKAVDNIGKTGHLRKSMVVRVVRGRKKKSELKAKCGGDVVARSSKYRIVLL